MKYKTNSIIETLLSIFLLYKGNYLKTLEEIAYNARPKIKEHMLIVMDKSTHEELLSQPLEMNNKQFKKTVTFLTG